MSDFNVGRVVGSPYMWDAVRNAKGEEDGSTWYLALSGRENPDYTDPNPNPSVRYMRLKLLLMQVCNRRHWNKTAAYRGV